MKFSRKINHISCKIKKKYYVDDCILLWQICFRWAASREPGAEICACWYLWIDYKHIRSQEHKCLKEMVLLTVTNLFEFSGSLPTLFRNSFEAPPSYSREYSFFNSCTRMIVSLLLQINTLSLLFSKDTWENIWVASRIFVFRTPIKISSNVWTTFRQHFCI